jgi:hypothetical protein
VAICLVFLYYFGQFLLQIRELAIGNGGRVAARLFLARLAAIDSGLSPLLPLLLLGLLLLLSYAWNFQRARALRAVTPFEAALMTLDVESTGDLGKLGHALRQVRDRLFFLVPDGNAMALALVLLCVVCIAYGRMDWTPETIAFARNGPSAFDGLLRLGLLATATVIPWAAYRFYSVWSAFRTFLDLLAERPAGLAFARLRNPAAEVSGWPWAEPRPLGSHAVQEATRIWWRQLSAASPLQAGSYAAALQNELSQLGDARKDAIRVILSGLERAGRLSVAPGPRPDLGAPQVPAADAPEAFLRRAEEFLALQIAAFLEHVMAQLWSLALVVFCSLALAGLLVSSYPTPAEAFLKLVLTVVLALTVVALISAAFQMSRDPVLSVVAGTKPGRVSWNFDLISKLLLFGLGPVIALVGTQYPVLRQSLGTWTQALLQMLKGP